MGYVHNTQMSQFVPPNAMNFVTGVWTDAAGQVANTVVKIKTAVAETSVINIPLMITSNASANTGGKINSIEIDYEIRTAAATSITLAVYKVTRGVDTAVAVATAITGVQTLTPATTAATADQHRDKFTITAPAYIDNDEYYFLKVTAVCAAGTVLEILGAVVNYTMRV